jgi:porin
VHGTALAYVEWDGSGNESAPVAWSGYFSALGVAGTGPTEKFVGDFLAASNIEAYESVRLYTWWLEAGFGDWSLRAGALLADDEFAGTEASGNLINSVFGWPAFISANTVNTGPAYFVAAPGIRLARAFGETASWQIGIYDGDSFDSPDGDPGITRHGLHYKIGDGQGAFVMTEAAFMPAGSNNRFKIGAWFHTATFSDVRDDENGTPFATSGNDPREHSSNHGAYATFERTLVGTAGEPGNVEAFVRFGFSPRDRNAISHAIDAGLAWTGPIPGRPADVVAFGIARATFSHPFSEAALLDDPTSTPIDFEQVIEASYTIQLSERFSAQPDLQYISHLGGTKVGGSAVIFLLRLNASY